MRMMSSRPAEAVALEEVVRMRMKMIKKSPKAVVVEKEKAVEDAEVVVAENDRQYPNQIPDRPNASRCRRRTPGRCSTGHGNRWHTPRTWCHRRRGRRPAR